MKKIIALFTLTLCLSVAVMAQCGTNSIYKDCVGACGAMTYTNSYTVQAGDVDPYTGVGLFCLFATSSSLCLSHNAHATLTRNGTSVQTGNLNLGDVLSMKGVVGSVFTIQIDVVLADPYINCVWFGETNWAFTRQ